MKGRENFPRRQKATDGAGGRLANTTEQTPMRLRQAIYKYIPMYTYKNMYKIVYKYRLANAKGRRLDVVALEPSPRELHRCANP